MRRVLAAVAATILTATLSSSASAAGNELQVRWTSGDAWASTLSAPVFPDGPTTIQVIQTNPVSGASPVLAPLSGAPAPTASYRIAPGSGLRGTFQVRNNSAGAARLAVFGQTTSDATLDGIVWLRISSSGEWTGPATSVLDGRCVVMGQRVLEPGQEITVGVDAFVPFRETGGAEGELSVTVPQITVALAGAEGTVPFTGCEAPLPAATSAPPTLTPSPSPPPVGPTPSSVPEPDESTPPRRRLGRTGGPAWWTWAGAVALLAGALLVTRRPTRR